MTKGDKDMTELTVNEMVNVNGGGTLLDWWDDAMEIIANRIPAFFEGIAEGWRDGWND